MYGVIKEVIMSGRYELADILAKIDTIWLQGDITDEEKAELVKMARDNANVAASIDFLKKLEELEKRVTTNENDIKELKQIPPEPTDEYPEYVPGKWYHDGDKVTFKGKKYICRPNPSSTVVTWSPEEYPDFWQLVPEEEPVPTETV